MKLFLIIQYYQNLLFGYYTLSNYILVLRLITSHNCSTVLFNLSCVIPIFIKLVLDQLTDYMICDYVSDTVTNPEETAVSQLMRRKSDLNSKILQTKSKVV